MKKILVIEDNQQHLENAKKLICQFTQFEFIFASTLREALKTESGVNSRWIRQFDAIITDLHFPLDSGNEPQQIGITIAMMGRFLGKPVAIVSDMDKHGESIRWMRELWNSFNDQDYFGPDAGFSWLIPETITEHKVEFLPETYYKFRDIYNPGNDGKKPYIKVMEDLITYWDK